MTPKDQGLAAVEYGLLLAALAVVVVGCACLGVGRLFDRSISDLCQGPFGAGSSCGESGTAHPQNALPVCLEAEREGSTAPTPTPAPCPTRTH